MRLLYICSFLRLEQGIRSTSLIERRKRARGHGKDGLIGMDGWMDGGSQGF